MPNEYTPKSRTAKNPRKMNKGWKPFFYSRAKEHEKKMKHKKIARQCNRDEKYDEMPSSEGGDPRGSQKL
jgi:hypothetical protein